MHSKTNQGEKKTKILPIPPLAAHPLSLCLCHAQHPPPFPVNNNLPGPHHHRDSHNKFVPISHCKAAYHTSKLNGKVHVWGGELDFLRVGLLKIV
jgi:hypothetical protein